MTVLSCIQDAALSLGLPYPSVVFSSTERTWQMMQSTVNECAIQIMETYDWQRLKKVATINGDGALTAFTLPADYDRMVKDANLWSQSFTWYPSQQVADVNQWLQMETYTLEPWEPRWSLFGGNLNIRPTLAVGQNLQYFYVSNWIVNGTTQRFTSDGDTFTLDERLLTLCIIWNWKKQQQQDYASELAEYEEAMGKATWKDTGSRQSIISGSRSGFYNRNGQTFP